MIHNSNLHTMSHFSLNNALSKGRCPFRSLCGFSNRPAVALLLSACIACTACCGSCRFGLRLFPEGFLNCTDNVKVVQVHAHLGWGYSRRSEKGDTGRWGERAPHSVLRPRQKASSGAEVFLSRFTLSHTWHSCANSSVSSTLRQGM